MAIIQSLPLGGSGSTYTNMTTDEAIAGTNTEERVVSAKVLNDAIDTKISDLVNSAPETLDTLNELASALGNDPNFATTIAGQIGSKANDSDVVHKSGNETVNGTKTFISSPRVRRVSPDIALNISDCDVTETPTEAKSATLYFRDKNNKNLSYVVSQQRTSGEKRMCLRTHRTDNIDNYYSVDLDSEGNFYPEQQQMKLGTSTNKWKDVYATTLHGDVDFSITEAQIAAIVV